MFRHLIVLPIIIVTALACKPVNKVSNRVVHGYVLDRWRDIVYLAWNEDTILTWQFSLYKDDDFLYTISCRDSSSGEIKHYFYRGKAKNTSDTLYLVYKSGQPQEKMTNFMVKEMSGNYLIQHFKDTSQRLFLRCLWQDRHGMYW